MAKRLKSVQATTGSRDEDGLVHLRKAPAQTSFAATQAETLDYIADMLEGLEAMASPLATPSVSASLAFARQEALRQLQHTRAVSETD